MNFVNHIAFGLFSANTALSLSNAEITNDIASIGVCVLSSIIPDIDHPNSLIGKITYPISKFIYSRFGHRTLTHSLFFVSLTVVSFFLFENLIFSKIRYSAIYAISIFSHVLLDMLTTDGVEVMFPFSKTRYLLFLNPRYRLKGGNVKHESGVLISIVIISILCLPLYKVGRSKLLSNNLNTITNVYEAFNESNNLLIVEYEIRQGGKFLNGNALVIDANPQKLVIFDREFIIVDSATKINKLIPTHKDHPLERKKERFKNMNFRDLGYFLKDKAIINLSIQTNHNMVYRENGKSTRSKNLNICYVLSPIIELEDGSIVGKTNEILASIKRLEGQLSTSDIVEREILSQELIKLRKELQNFKSLQAPFFDVEVTYIASAE